MRRYLVIAIASVHLALLGSPSLAAPIPAAGCFDSSFAGESAFLTLQQFQTGTFSAMFTNTGTCSWIVNTSNQVDLAQGLPLGSPSPNSCWGVNWLSATAYATTSQPVVAPGQVGAFTYAVKAPEVAPPGTYRFDGDLVVSATGQALNPQGYYQEVNLLPFPGATTGGVQGQVTASVTGRGVVGATVQAIDAAGLGAGAPTITAVTSTDTCGYYTMELPTGTYRTGYFPPSGSGLHFEYHADALTVYAATNIGVGPIGRVPIDAALSPVRTISGSARAASGAAVSNVLISVFDAGSNCPTTAGGCGNFANAATDTAGAFSVTVPIGTFKILFDPSSTTGSTHAAEFWQNDDDFSTATSVSTVAGDVTGIDLTFRGAISGKVTAPSPAPVVSVQVHQDFSGTCNILRSQLTDPNGQYAIPFGSTSMSLKIQFVPLASGMPAKWWDNKTSCASADVISWTGVDVTNVNVILP